MKRRGRKPATGRFENNEQLVQFVREHYAIPGMKQAWVAKAARVSETTVANILNRRESP